MCLFPEGGKDSLGSHPGEDLPAVQDQEPVCHGQHLVQPVLCDDNGGAQIPVDAAQSGQKVGGSNGIQLAGWLVQNEDLRLHGHDGGQVQQLLLSTGEGGDVPVKPGLDAKKAGHFRHPAPDGSPVIAQTFQAKGQLVPDLVCHNLIVRVLLDKANFGCLGPGVHLL